MKERVFEITNKFISELIDIGEVELNLINGTVKHKRILIEIILLSLFGMNRTNNTESKSKYYYCYFFIISS